MAYIAGYLYWCGFKSTLQHDFNSRPLEIWILGGVSNIRWDWKLFLNPQVLAIWADVVNMLIDLAVNNTYILHTNVNTDVLDQLFSKRQYACTSNQTFLLAGHLIMINTVRVHIWPPFQFKCCPVHLHQCIHCWETLLYVSQTVVRLAHRRWWVPLYTNI